ncbi:ADP-D-ribose binding [Paramecium bursaria]
MGNKSMCCGSKGGFQNSNDMCVNPQNLAKANYQGCTVSLSLSRIFNEDCDAIVMIASNKLKLGENMTSTIKRQGGQSILNEIKRILLEEGGKLQYGQVVYTHGGDLEFDYIFYAVLPSTCDSSMLVNKSYGTDDCVLSNSIQENLKFNDCDFVYTEKLSDTTQTHERQQIYEAVINCLGKAQTLGIKVYSISCFRNLISAYFEIQNCFHNVTCNQNVFERESKSLFIYQNFCISKILKYQYQDAPTLNLFRQCMSQIFLNDESESTADRGTYRMSQEEPKPQHSKKKKKQETYKSHNQEDPEFKFDDLIHFCQEPNYIPQNKSSF